MGDELGRVDLVRGRQLQQVRRGVRVDQPGGDRHVLDPQLLEMECGRLAVYADVGDVATGPNQAGRQLERGGDPDGFDGDVGPETVGQLANGGGRVLTVVVDDRIGSKL